MIPRGAKHSSLLLNAEGTRAVITRDPRNPEGFREGIKEIKTSSIANLDSLLTTFMDNCKLNGNKVLVAKDGKQVVDYILDLAYKNNVTLIEKSKSLTTEEIELNHHLIEGKKDLNVVETDLGERIIQLVDEKPYHLVFPAIHKTQGEVAEIFTRATGSPVPNDLPAIMDAVRKHLRPTFLNAQLGITGANIGVAETGSIIVETNEGNARLVSAVPDIHVIVVGMEKIISSWDEALKLVMAHPISATGTRLTNYVSIVTERLPLGENRARETPRDHFGQRQDQDASGPLDEGGAGLHPLRRVHERLSDLRSRGRPHLWVHLPWTDRHPVDRGSARAGQGRGIRPPLHFLRPLQGDLSRGH